MALVALEVLERITNRQCSASRPPVSPTIVPNKPPQCDDDCRWSQAGL